MLPVPQAPRLPMGLSYRSTYAPDFPSPPHTDASRFRSRNPRIPSRRLRMKSCGPDRAPPSARFRAREFDIFRNRTAGPGAKGRPNDSGFQPERHAIRVDRATAELLGQNATPIRRLRRDVFCSARPKNRGYLAARPARLRCLGQTLAARRHLRPREEGEVRAGMSVRVRVKQMISAGIILVHAPLTSRIPRTPA